MSIEYLVVTVILLINFFDGARDATYNNPEFRKKIRFFADKWHLIKWLSFYPLQVFCTVYFLNYWLWLPLAFISLISWHSGAKRIGHVNWSSHWFDKIRNMLK